MSRMWQALYVQIFTIRRKSYQYMCNIVKSRVNNSKSSRTYTQEARETPVLNLITL